MSIFAPLFFVFIVALLLVDRVLLPRAARVAWTAMATVMLAGAVLAVYPAPLAWLAQRLGVGRAVDMVLYLVAVLTVRDFFMNRSRFSQIEDRSTTLIRALALDEAQRIDDPADELPSGTLK